MCWSISFQAVAFLHRGFTCAEGGSAHEEMRWAQTPAEGVTATLPQYVPKHRQE